MPEIGALAILVAAVAAGVAAEAGIDEAAGGLALGLASWAGFPSSPDGRRARRRTPPKLAAFHGGDRLLKVPVVAVIAAVLR